MTDSYVLRPVAPEEFGAAVNRKNMGARELTPPSKAASPVTLDSRPGPTLDNRYPPICEVNVLAAITNRGFQIRPFCAD
jgi:hypothetical protein